MQIDLKFIPISEVYQGYLDSGEEGVVAWSGNLNIRPKYQREFIYSPQQEQQVIYSVLKGFPLSTMYWSKQDDQNNKYEILDGQQRTLSICRFIDNKYFIDIEGYPKKFINLSKDQKDLIFNYPLMIYLCEGTDQEKLNWFEIINIAGEKLNDQELRNAVYTGSWLTNAKSIFSRTNCPAKIIGEKYIKGSPIRQDYLEKALKWISNGDPAQYMAEHQNDEDANSLWQYFQSVIQWVERIFPNYNKDMKSVDWGYLYNNYKDVEFNSNLLSQRFISVLQDDEVQLRTTKGIYYYLITKEEKHLNLRAFDFKHKALAFQNQQGKCIKRQNQFLIEELQADHIVPWSKGGKTIQDNCQLLCQPCNATKSNS